MRKPTLIEFASRHGKTKNYVDPEKVEAITCKNVGDGSDGRYVTVLMLTSGNYIPVDCSPDEAAERLSR